MELFDRVVSSRADVLVIEIKRDGGVVISGRADELRDLAAWVMRAIADGRSEATFVADRGLSRLVVEVDD
jgi:hypothetical protein